MAARNITTVPKPKTLQLALTSSAFGAEFDILDVSGDGVTPITRDVDGTPVSDGFMFDKDYVLTVSQSVTDDLQTMANAGIDNVSLRENFDSGSGFIQYPSVNIVFGEGITTNDGWASVPVSVHAEGFELSDIRSYESTSFIA